MAGRGGASAAVSGGGARPRIPRPMYEPINTSTPSESDKELDAKLEAFMTENVPVMSKPDLRRREVVLGKLRGIFLQVQFRLTRLMPILLLLLLLVVVVG